MQETSRDRGSEGAAPGGAAERLAPRSRGVRTLGALAAASVLAFAVLELGLRWLDLPRASFEFLNPEPGMTETFVEDEELFWKLSPRAQQFQVNQHGLRGYWPPPESRVPGRELRLACVGDSCTFGYGVRYEDAYGIVLERLLRERLPNRAVTSVLLANTGYSTHQSRVLFERLAPELRPDWTILYCGAWNDQVPAIGRPDAERATGAGLRTLELGARAFSRAPERAVYERALEHGDYPDGPRVSEERFRENLVALVERAQSTGRALIVAPPLPPRTLAGRPLLLAYREIARSVASELGLPLVDGDAVFADFLAGLPEQWQTDAIGKPILFHDAIHPSALGHRVLAQALALVIGAEEQDGAAAAWQLAATALDPVHVGWRGPAVVRVTGSGFAGRDGPVLRAWLGEHWMEEVRTLDDGALELATRGPIEPGALALALVTPRGTLSTSLFVHVAGPALEAEVVPGTEDGAGARLVVRLRGRAGETAGIWVGDRLRVAPEDTAGGDFWVATATEGRPAGRSDLPFRFDLAHSRIFGLVGADGAFAVDVPLAPEPEDELFLQGAVWWGEQGALSAPLRVSLPR